MQKNGLADPEDRKPTCIFLQNTQVIDAFHSIVAQKKGKLSTSHRYDLLPLLPSDPGGIQRELVVYDFP